MGHGFLGCLPVISVVGQGHNEQRAPEYQVGHRDYYEHLHLLDIAHHHHYHNHHHQKRQQGHNEQRAPEYQVGHRDHYEHFHLVVMIMMNIIMMMSRMMFLG